MNKKGSALAETLLLLPIFVLLLSQMQWISRGWIIRVKNRVISRYTATYAARHDRLPSKFDVQRKFNLNPDEIGKLHIESHQSTRWRFRSLWIQHHYTLWKKTTHEAFFKDFF